MYYLAGAQHAQIDPAHPNHGRYVFLGDLVDMRGHPHPPLNAWALAALLAWFGDVYEVPFHFAYIFFSLLAAVSVWSLAKRFSPRPLLATALFLFTPAFVVNGNSLEADIPFLAFWLAAIALTVKAIDRRSWVWLACSVVAAMLSAGTVEIHHRYRILGSGGVAPIEGEVMVTGPKADPDAMGKRQPQSSGAAG